MLNLSQQEDEHDGEILTSQQVGKIMPIQKQKTVNETDEVLKQNGSKSQIEVVQSQQKIETIPKTGNFVQPDIRQTLKQINSKKYIQQNQEQQQQQQQEQQPDNQQKQSQLQQANQQQPQLTDQYEESQLIEQLRRAQTTRIQINQNEKESSLIIFNDPNKLTKKDPLRASLQSDKFQADFRNIFLILAHQNQLINPLKLVINQNIDINNPEVLFYVLSDQMRQTGRVFYKSLKPDQRLMYSFHGQFTADSLDSQAFCLTLQETQCFKYQHLAQDKLHRQDFIKYIQQYLAIDLKVQVNQIQIIAIEEGSIKVIFQVIDHASEVHVNQNLEELKKQFPGSSPQLLIHNFFKEAALSVDDFNPKYDMTWDKFDFGKNDNRGPKGNTQPYFFPIGWKGFALNVAGRYGDNDNWLMMNGNKDEWYVMFHGTTFGGVKQIMKDGRNIKSMPKGDQTYRNDYCIITKEKIGEGVYFSNHIEVCENYSYDREKKSNIPTPISDKQFIVAFQSRVRPGALRQCRKRSDIRNRIVEYKKKKQSYDPSLNNMDLWDNDYFVINNTDDIRPYRILLKEITVKKK